MKAYNIVKTALLVVMSGGLLAGSCSKYDDTEIWEKVDELDQRVTNLESTLSQLNTDINDLKILLEAKQGGVNITSVTQTAEGYTVTFSDGKTITLRHGKDGNVPEIRDGYWWIGDTNTYVKAQGEDGVTPQIINGYWWIGNTNTNVPATGGNGSGTTVNVPIIGVQEYNGVYYWTQTINGITTFLTDKNGNKFPVSGSGSVKPLIQISLAGYWVISYDGGKTWVQILNESGDPVKATGGECNCKTFFLDVHYADGILILVLADGQTVQIPCEANADIRYDLVIPAELRRQLSSYMPIYTGLTPPNIEGTYLIESMTTKFCSDFGNGGFAPGTVRNSLIIRFKNQNEQLKTVDIDQNELNAGISGSKNVYISGADNNFTVYYNVVLEQNGVTAKEAIVVSGTKASNGIKDCYYALLMVEKDSDPSGKFMSVGAYRVFKDGDGLSENTTWVDASRSDEWRQSSWHSSLSQMAE